LAFTAAAAAAQGTTASFNALQALCTLSGVRSSLAHQQPGDARDATAGGF
jgi:hypothetical protein